jgi:nucleotide-binding universal stress UspA family protein
MKPLTYFVPIDFTQASYNALQYAVLLAKESDGQVKLCHVLDLNEIPESDNPVVVSLALDKLLQEAGRKLKSLREFISLDSINVGEDIIMGSIRYSLINRIEKVKPDVIVMGRRTESKINRWSVIHYITKNTSTPVLVIPQNHNPKIPDRAAVTIDVHPELVVKFKALLSIIKKISPEISILNIRGSKENANRQDWIEDLRSNYGIKAQFLSGENTTGAGGLDHFIKENKIDLLYNVKAKKSWLGRLLSSVHSAQQDNSAVPYLNYNAE